MGSYNEYTSEIYFDLCRNTSLTVCNGNGINVCQNFSNKMYSLGSFYNITFVSNNIQIRYEAKNNDTLKNCDTQVSYERYKRVTEFRFICNKNVPDKTVVYASETQQCHYEIRMESKGFCDCENCVQPHYICYNGKCQCDQYTTGENCKQLKINISNIVPTSIYGGIGYLIGDFRSIVPNFEVFIGGSKCEYRDLLGPSTIQIYAPPGHDLQSVKITDGISSYLSPILFQYKFTPCIFNCSQPHGICDLEYGVCSCDKLTIGNGCESLNIQIHSIISTTINGGVGYLNGDFQFITPNFKVFVGETLCSDVKLVNATTIRISVPPDNGLKKIYITDGISSYSSLILFEYINVPCLYNCSQPHGECNLFLGVCTCDSQTNGTGCEFLNIKIDSINSTTINGGIGYINGDFQFIIPNFNVFVGEKLIIDFELVNDTIIEISVPPGVGFKNVTITDGISSYCSPILFEYINVPCLSNCSQPHGECNLFLGICICDTQTNGTGCEFLNIKIDSINSTTINGGIAYINGDFQFIIPNFNVFVGEKLIIDFELVNDTTIEISVPPGVGFKNVTITDGISSYLSPILFEYINVQCLSNCSQPHGECNLILGICTCDTQTNGTGCENSRIYIDSIDPTDENGGTTYLYGYFGNTTLNLYIQIGDNHCNNTQQINETLIKCDVGVGSGFKDVLLQDRDLQVKVEKLFQYFAPITTNAPKQCFNKCGGPNQGVCLSSGCSCILPWIGNDCMSKIVIIPQPLTNFSNPSTEIPVFESINNTNKEMENKLFLSLISIVKLRELNFKSKEVNSFTFKEWEFKIINSETSQYKTYFTNLGSNTTVTVTLQWFKNETDFEFGNQIIKMSPSSIKYTIEISEFKFSSKLNQLQLIMKASISVNKTNEVCSDKEFGETSNGDDSNYLKVQVDNHSLYGRFIKRALIDSIPRSIENVQLDSSMNIVDTASQSQSFIGISVPFFKKQIIIDPDFSILFGKPFNSDNSICLLNDSSGNFSKTKISAIVICGFFGIVTVSIISIYFYYKKKQNRNVINELRLKITTKPVNILIYVVFLGFVNSYRSEIVFDLCRNTSLKECNGNGINACQTLSNSETFSLGSFYNVTFGNISQIRYKADVSGLDIESPSSIKYTIEISEFKFSSKLNQLQLIMKASISVNKTNEVCSDKEFGETSNGDDSNYLKVQVDNHSLYGRFIKRALIDSIPRSIENVQLDSSMNIVDTASQSQSFIGISVPYFKKQIIIDPDFSILVGTPFNSDNSICSLNDSNGFSKTKISAIVICGFLVIMALSTIAIYGYYKNKHDRNLINELRLKMSKKEVNILM
ncbi:hypothetical protein ACTFIR_009896 [Dictyostelium discoideum]